MTPEEFLRIQCEGAAGLVETLKKTKEGRETLKALDENIKEEGAGTYKPDKQKR